MSTIKNFTSLEQSKKLAEFLPLESADMWWPWYSNPVSNGHYDDFPMFYKPICNPDESVPCWSLAALLGVLPKNLNIGRPSLESNYKGYYWIQYYDGFMLPNNYKTEVFNNPVDACVAMVELLHELEML